MQSTRTVVCLEGMAGHLWIKFLQKMLFLHSCLPPSLVLGTSKMCIHAERLIITVSIIAITITIMIAELHVGEKRARGRSPIA